MTRTETRPGVSGFVDATRERGSDFVDATRERGSDFADDVRMTGGQARDVLGGAIDRLSTLEWPKIDLPSVDVGKAVAGAAAAAHIGRRARRRRWPLVVGGLMVAGLASWAIASREVLRTRLALGARTIRNQISAARSNLRDRTEIERGHPTPFSAAETAPIEASQFTDSTTPDAAGYPLGLGSNNGDGVPDVEEAGRPSLTTSSGEDPDLRPRSRTTARGT